MFFDQKEIEKRNKQRIKLKIDKYKNMKRRLENHYFEEESIDYKQYKHDNLIYSNIINDLYDIISSLHI